MIKIRVFADCTKSSVFLDTTDIKDDSDYGKTFCFTNNNDYTHVILINCITPKISHIPKENVIGLAFEPIQILKSVNEKKFKSFIQYAQKHIKKYFIGDKKDLPEPFVEGFGYINPTIIYPDISKKVEKSNIMSIMISRKKWAPGHNYRHILMKKILQENLPVDIHGHGCKDYNSLKNNRLKGSFRRGGNEPYESYMFHIAIENYQCNHYFSEKIMNTLLSNTTPIYLGCKNIDDYFPDAVIKLNGDLDHDIKLIKNICENPKKYQKQIDINKVKKTISIKNIIDEFFLAKS
tara:strand:+ start:1400 stop:2275 length:876 start_codon:yes stop_codon:yes gene_type:complete